MTRPLAMLDLETTGVGPDDEPWEFAAIIRDPDGSESEHHFFIDHDPAKAEALPESFREDHDRRFGVDAPVVTRVFAARLVDQILAGATIVGAIPWFDTGHLQRLLADVGLQPSWHHRLRCVESMACGALCEDVGGLSDVAKAFGIETPAAHTAMGDVLTVRAIWDRLMGAPE